MRKPETLYGHSPNGSIGIFALAESRDIRDISGNASVTPSAPPSSAPIPEALLLIADNDSDAPDATTLRRLELAADERATGDHQERFRATLGQLTPPAAVAGGEDDGTLDLRAQIFLKRAREL